MVIRVIPRGQKEGAKEKFFLAPRLRQARFLRGISREEIARRCDVPVKQVWFWETGRGNPGPRYLDKICEAVGIGRATFYVSDSEWASALRVLRAAIIARQKKADPEGGGLPSPS